MPTYRAEIVWDFPFDDKGYLDWEYDLRDEDEELPPRTAEEMAELAKSELLEALYNGVKYNDLYNMIDVVEVPGD